MITATSSGAKSYILRSTLHDSILEQAIEVFEDLHEAELQDAPEGDDDMPQPAGTILSWNTSDQLNGLGILYIVLSLILVSNHNLKDGKWFSACNNFLHGSHFICKLSSNGIYLH